MKPKITCRSCSAEIEWGVEKCSSCGTAVEWPTSGQKTTAKKTNGQPAPQGGIPMRTIAAVVIFIGLGVVLMEFFSGSGSVPESIPQQQNPAANMGAPDGGADMSALPHIEELEAQLRTDPENQEVRRELGNHLMDARFYHRAISVYREFLDREPGEPNIRVDMGICYKELGDLESAEKEMKQALEYVPTHLHAHFNLGIVNLVQGELEESSEWFQKTAQLDPQGQLGQRAQQLLDQHLSVEIQ